MDRTIQSVINELTKIALASPKGFDTPVTGEYKGEEGPIESILETANMGGWPNYEVIEGTERVCFVVRS